MGNFYKRNKCPVDQKTRYLSKSENGLGMLKLAHFLMALQLSWLRILPYTKSVWGKWHKEEVGKLCFCPVNSSLEDLEKAKIIIKNSVRRDIYCALLKCRANYVGLHPEEFLTIPINKEPDLTANFIGIQQDWSIGTMLHKVLDSDGNLCTFNNLRTPKQPVRMEYDAFEKAIRKKLEILKTHYYDDFCAFLKKFKPIFGIFNIYGRIVLKKNKGCTFFYKLVNS